MVRHRAARHCAGWQTSLPPAHVAHAATYPGTSGYSGCSNGVRAQIPTLWMDKIAPLGVAEPPARTRCRSRSCAAARRPTARPSPCRTRHCPACAHARALDAGPKHRHLRIHPDPVGQQRAAQRCPYQCTTCVKRAAARARPQQQQPSSGGCAARHVAALQPSRLWADSGLGQDGCSDERGPPRVAQGRQCTARSTHSLYTRGCGAYTCDKRAHPSVRTRSARTRRAEAAPLPSGQRPRYDDGASPGADVAGARMRDRAFAAAGDACTPSTV